MTSDRGPARTRPPVAVIGMGVIGKANARMLASAGYSLVTYDIADGIPYPADRIALCDWAMICVGTPEAHDGSADLSFVSEALGKLPSSMPVLIRSTMPPGTMSTITAHYQDDRPMCHAPEFMHERAGGAWSESDDVPFLILGGSQDARNFFRPRLDMFPKIHECDALTAELVKYTINLHLATRVTFINEMDAICREFGADWEDVRQAWLMDPRITPEYTGGIKEFGPGFGGRCWPKDLSALIEASAEKGYAPQFLLAIREANRRFRGGE